MRTYGSPALDRGWTYPGGISDAARQLVPRAAEPRRGRPGPRRVRPDPRPHRDRRDHRPHLPGRPGLQDPEHGRQLGLGPRLGPLPGREHTISAGPTLSVRRLTFRILTRS